MRKALVMVIALTSFQSVAIADWANLWSTPEQRARKAFESGDHEALLDQAPDQNWKGLGQFQSGDYDAASQTFSEMDTPQALYNQAVSDVMGGRYQEALANFDTLLTDDPEHTDAAHNREIVQKLIELQEQQQQQQQQQQGEQGDGSDQSQEQGEQQQDGQQGQDQQQSQDGQQSDESTQGDEQSQQQGSDQNSDQSSGNDGNQQNDTDSGGTQSDAERSAEDARQALAAEAEQGEQSEDSGAEQSDASGISEEERPLTESEQATEQWLRRIPDDPAGLLRRKLEQSHRNEFPEVRDAIDPW